MTLCAPGDPELKNNTINFYIKKWSAFCFQHKTNSLQPSVNNVMNFLHIFHVQSCSYSLIKTARSALSNYLKGFEFTGSNFTVSNHLFIFRNLKGVFNCSKPTPRYQETRNVGPVFRYIELLYTLDKLSLKN